MIEGNDPTDWYMPSFDEPNTDVTLTLQELNDVMTAIDIALEERIEYHDFLLKHPELDDYSEDDKTNIEALEGRLEDVKKVLVAAAETLDVCDCGMGPRGSHYGTPEHEFWLLQEEREGRL